jgi:hypothetical protein
LIFARRSAQAQVQAAEERAILSSQEANAKFAAAAARNTAAHPYVFASFPPKERVTAPRPTKTMPLAMRTLAQPRRWRYSHGEIMSRRPDRGGDAHHPRRPSGAELLFGAFIGMPPVGGGVGHPTLYQYDITFDR